MIIIKLLQDKKLSPSEIYQSLNRKGHSNRDKDGGLGKTFTKKSRHALVSEAFNIDDKNQNLSIRNINKLYELAQSFKTGDHLKQNHNKYAICLALVCYYASLDEKNIYDKALNELEIVFSKSGSLKDKDGIIIKLIAEKRKLLEAKPVVIQVIMPIEKLEEMPVSEEKIQAFIPQEPTQPTHDHPVESKIEVEEKPISEVKTQAFITQEPAQPERNQSVESKIELQELPNKEQKIMENSDQQPYKDIPTIIRKFLVNMNSQTPDDYSIRQMKVFQKRYFCSQLGNFDIDELKYLCQLMSEVQSGQNRSLHFAILRREECEFFSNGNTEAWQQIYHAAKQQLIKKLKDAKHYQEKIPLEKQEYDSYINLLNNHSGRWYATLWGKTRSCTDFENSFESLEESPSISLKT